MCDGYADNKQKVLTSESESLLKEGIRSMLRILEQK